MVEWWLSRTSRSRTRSKMKRRMGVGMVRAFRAILFGVLALALSGCGLARQQEMQARNAALKQQSDAAFQECKAKFPEVVVATVVANASLKGLSRRWAAGFERDAMVR